MKSNPLISICSFLLLVSCQQKKSTPSAASNNQPDSTAYFSRNPDHYYFNFDSAKTEIENYNAGYTDTFSINGHRFKLYANPAAGSNLSLDVFRDSSWQPNLKLSFGTNGLVHDTDINNDGFTDFQNSLLRGTEVYLFDPGKQQFSDNPVYLSFDWGKIAADRNFYYNNYESANLQVSNLFLLAGFKQSFLYSAMMYYPTDPAVNQATIKLYKLFNHNLNDTQFVSEKRVDIPDNGFDYKKFWQEALSKTEYR